MIATLGDSLADVLSAVAGSDDVRHDRTRKGDRQPIPDETRFLVYKRDGFSCLRCGARGVPLQLDHVVPWSAGGPDIATNLRSACVPCNQQRSNFRDVLAPTALLPVIRECIACQVGRWPRAAEVVTAYCGTCNERSRAYWDEVK